MTGRNFNQQAPHHGDRNPPTLDTTSGINDSLNAAYNQSVTGLWVDVPPHLRGPAHAKAHTDASSGVEGGWALWPVPPRL
jgi:hypothetical protein